MINTILIQGRLGKDGERKNSFFKFSIAHNYKIKDQEKTTWVSINTFGKLADACEKYLKKGSEVVVEGSLQIDEYDGKYYTYIFAEKVEFLNIERSQNNSDKGLF